MTPTVLSALLGMAVVAHGFVMPSSQPDMTRNTYRYVPMTRHSEVKTDRAHSLQLTQKDMDASIVSSRRILLQQCATLSSALLVSTLGIKPLPALATDSDTSLAAGVTDKVFVDIKGLPGADGSIASGETKRIVIGLFGKEAPRSTDKIKKLMSTAGLAAKCKPKEKRVLEREQLEANKVYNSCIEGESKGVNYDYATVWRVVKGERIDFGSVAGRFVAREFPTWEEDKVDTSLKHDRPGIVSVRRGSDSGFGFSVYPGGGSATDLDDDHIVVGQVLEGMDVIEQLNAVPVITSAKVNYMALVGGPTTKSAPSRSCRYGGDMYCNENKPLIKLTISKTGVV